MGSEMCIRDRGLLVRSSSGFSFLDQIAVRIRPRRSPWHRSSPWPRLSAGVGLCRMMPWRCGRLLRATPWCTRSAVPLGRSASGARRCSGKRQRSLACRAALGTLPWLVRWPPCSGCGTGGGVLRLWPLRRGAEGLPALRLVLIGPRRLGHLLLSPRHLVELRRSRPWPVIRSRQCGLPIGVMSLGRALIAPTLRRPSSTSCGSAPAGRPSGSALPRLSVWTRCCWCGSFLP